MILDEILIDELSELAGIQQSPKNLEEVYKFFKELEKKITQGDYRGELIGFIFFNFLTKKEIRDRKVTSRVCEDIMSKLFKGKTLDEDSKPNPEITEELENLDKLYEENLSKFDFKISKDLAGNKREKADNQFGNYYLSIKTLKGKLYDKNLKIEDNKPNPELNIGSLSYRSLLVGLLADSELTELSDRKGGLGSGKQMIETIYNPLKQSGKWTDFIERLEIFMKYVYSESDFLVVFKSGYKMELNFIHEKDFIDELINLAREDYAKFFQVFYRWENNNLRIHYEKLFKILEDKKKLKKIVLRFNTAEDSENIKSKMKEMKKAIHKTILS